MGTTRIKVIDLSSDQKQIKTSRKHAEKLAGVAKIEKEEKKSKETQPKTDRPLDEKVTITEGPLRPRSEASESRSNERNESNESNVLPTTEETQHDASATLEKKAETAKTEKKTSDSSDSSVTSVTSTKKHQSKKYIAAKKSVEPKIYGAKEALSLLPKTSTVKFDASVEVHLNVIDKSVRAKVNFPHNAGAKKKEKKYLIFTDKRLTIHDKHIIWGDEKTIAEIESAKLKPGKDFDVVVASPKYMPLLAKIAKVLGPKGLMPNPKNGTVVEDAAKYFDKNEGGATQFKIDPTTPVIHAKIGKISQGEKELSENLKALIVAIGPGKIRKAVITTTMGPSIKFDSTSA